MVVCFFLVFVGHRFTAFVFVVVVYWFGFADVSCACFVLRVCVCNFMWLGCYLLLNLFGRLL